MNYWIRIIVFWTIFFLNFSAFDKDHHVNNLHMLASYVAGYATVII